MDHQEFDIKPYRQAHRNQLIKVWEDSVLATHYFLKKEDFEKIKSVVEHIDFNLLQVYCLLKNNQVFGFLGVSDQKLEMLFLNPLHFGKGLGRLMADFAIQNLECRQVDVNEQNESARKFDEKIGFKVVGRSEKDGLGMPYPLVHMEL